MSGHYGEDGWDEPDDGDDYNDEPPDPKPRPIKHYNRGGAGKRKGKSPHQHVRNWRFSMPHGVTFMRDWDYHWYRLTVPRQGGPINVRKVWRKTIHRHRLNRHRLKRIEF